MIKRHMKHVLGGALAGVLAFTSCLAPFSVQQAHAAASTQTLHAVLCSPEPSSAIPGPRRVTNTSSSTGGSYNLNSQGCAVMAYADVGFFLSQGFTYGPNTFSLQQTAISLTNTSTATNMTLPAFTTILSIAVQETAGNAVTGGLNVGDSGSATRFLSALTVGANANVGAPPVLSTGSGTGSTPAADVIYLACASACASAPIVNVTIIYGYY